MANNDFIIPMSPIMHSEIPDNPDFTYQVKWDGVRMIAYINNHNVKLINKRLNNRTKQYPELNILSRLIEGSNAIIDGDIMALLNGKPSFPTVMRRDGTTNEKNIALLQKKIPILYMVFDILFLNGQDLRNLPWHERADILSECLKPQDNIQIVENFSTGSNLFTAVKAQGLEGIVAKQKDSPYVSGKKHRYWLKIKYRRPISCVIGGFTLNNKTVNALLAGVYDEGKLIYIGRVGTGLKAAEWVTLTEQLTKLETPNCPFSSLPPSVSKIAHFVKPSLTVEVEYSEWTLDMQLRSSSIIGFGQKKPPECQLP